MLLACRFPFTGTDAPTVRREAQQPIDFPPRPWNVISPEAKDLIRQLLQFDPAKRPTAQQAIHHPVRFYIDTAADAIVVRQAGLGQCSAVADNVGHRDASEPARRA